MYGENNGKASENAGFGGEIPPFKETPMWGPQKVALIVVDSVGGPPGSWPEVGQTTWIGWIISLTSRKASGPNLEKNSQDGNCCPTFLGKNMGNIVSISMLHSFFLKRLNKGKEKGFTWVDLDSNVGFFYSRHQEESLHKENGRVNGFPWERDRPSLCFMSAFPVFPNDTMIWDEWQIRGLDWLSCFTIGFSVIFLESLTPVMFWFCVFFPIFFSITRNFHQILWVHLLSLNAHPKHVIVLHHSSPLPYPSTRCSDPGDVCRALVP